MKLTYTQCKQLKANYGDDWRDIVEAMSDQPEWIVDKLDIADIHTIQRGGTAAGGAGMQAEECYRANATMAEHGDDVLDYIQDVEGELPKPADDISWSGLAVFYLSYAVELWCGQFDLYGVDWD